MESEHPPTTANEPADAPLDPETAIDRLIAAGDWPDPALIDQILAFGESAIAPLLDRMRTALEKPDKSTSEILYYGAGILGELAAPAAIPVLVEILRRDPEDIGEFAAEVLGDLGTIALEPALELIEDPGITGYFRVNAIIAAKRAAGDDPALRARLGDVLRPLLAHAIERDRVERAAIASDRDDEQNEGPEDWVVEGRHDDEFEEDDDEKRQERYESQAIKDPAPLELEPGEELMFLIGDLADLADAGSRELIDQAFEENLVDEFWIDKESVDEFYEHGGVPSQPRVVWLEGYRRRRQEYLEYQSRPRNQVWPTLQAAAGSGYGRPIEVSEPPPPETIRNVGPKVGRNDPCWCGSGKKYKKCHLGKDERA